MPSRLQLRGQNNEIMRHLFMLGNELLYIHSICVISLCLWVSLATSLFLSRTTRIPISGAVFLPWGWVSHSTESIHIFFQSVGNQWSRFKESTAEPNKKCFCIDSEVRKSATNQFTLESTRKRKISIFKACNWRIDSL